MRIILTNDDGIGAPGLEALRKVGDALGECVIAAPHTEQSGFSHTVTTKAAIHVEEVGPGCFRVMGTPADCVRVAVTELCPDATWVLSGVNRGGNLGADTYMSGTVAAAREAALLGRPAAAISQLVIRDRPLDWELTATRLRPVLEWIVSQEVRPATFWNVNLPHPEHQDNHLERVMCPLDTNPLQVRYRRDGSHFHYAGDYQSRPRTSGSDVDVCFQGRIAITRLPLG